MGGTSSNVNFDDPVKIQKNAPSPLMGEGWGEGEESRNSNKLFIPLPFIPSRQGRGDSTFYGTINFPEEKKASLRGRL
jgi:hypothetical protein